MNDYFALPQAQPFEMEKGDHGVLLIHGFTGSPSHMRLLGEALAERGYSVRGIRLPGHGTKPEDMKNVSWQDWLLSARMAAKEMRKLVKKSTTVICMATMLHTIATGNMTPSFAVTEDGAVRPTFLYCVDAAEFAVNKLTDRGSLSSVGIVTNVQDFITIIARGLGVMD